MLFDPRPKASRKELYDREPELRILDEFTRKGSPILVMLGIRRIGKTSILRVFLNEANLPYIYIDARVFEEQGFRKDLLYKMLFDGLNRLRGRWASILKYLMLLEGVEVGAASIRFNWKETSLSISDIFVKIDEWAGDNGKTIIIAVDEAQLLRYLKGGKGRIDFTKIISYCYDNLRNIKFIVTGSEIGVLTDFLGFNNPNSPLYGRVKDELTITRFDREKSIDFLEKGFNECSVRPPHNIIEEIVDRVDGIPGWLTYFGYKYCRKPSSEIVREVFNEAKVMALNEIRKLPSKYYIYTLKAISIGYRRWKNIKQAVELWTNRSLTNAQISRILQTLLKLNLIEKEENEYRVTDPVIAETVKEL
ncbi:MAG: ATP-binding protein [Desulfurococcales archaeon]|nr:ATP-binding protein [Desulfurococcales archaeon]